jgi:quinoprotein dehydrogenase-associated probable ABC transporter substrate-binding protein
VRTTRSRRRALVAFGVAALAAAAPALAQVGEILDRTELRVCADPNNLPFSNEKKEGFENKIADVIGDELKLPVHYVFFPQIIGFVRNTLRARTCDLIVGTIAGDDLVQTTNPYYYSAYVAVYRGGDGFTFSGFDDPKLKSMKIGIVGATPPSNLLVHHDLMSHAKPYALTVDTRYESPTHQMLEDLANKEIDVGLLWGPIAGYYIKRDKLPLRMAVLRNEPNEPRMDYRIAMGVRAGEPEWRRRVNAAIIKRQPEITGILKEYGVPLLDEQGHLIEDP